MKIILLVVLAVFYSVTQFAQIPGWHWAKRYGLSAHDEGRSVATDAHGNVILTGHAAYNVYTVKYDNMGNQLWDDNTSGNYAEASNDVAVDAAGNILITGLFISDTLFFGADTLVNATGGNTSGDIFIVKYDSLGNVLWAKREGGIDGEEGTSITTDGNGNVFVSGTYYGDSIRLGSTTLYNASLYDNDIFLVKYDSSGNFLWAKGGYGDHQETISCVTTDANGSVFITGSFNSDSIWFGSTTFQNTGMGPEIFLVKYDSSGNQVWANHIGGYNGAKSNSMAIDGDGNINLTGLFVGSITIGTTTLNAVGEADVLLVKYDSSGNVIWAKGAGGIEADVGTSVATDIDGNIFITGFFVSYSIDFGTTTLMDTSYGTYDGDVFVAMYDSSGNVIWAKRAGGRNDDRGLAIALDADENIFVAGYFDSGTISFGSTILTNAYPTSTYSDMFIAKLTTGPVGINEFFSTENGIAVFPNPANRQFEVSNSTNIEDLKIINLLGQTVYQNKIQEKGISLQLKEAGVYFVQVTTGKKTITKKLVVY